MRKCKEGATYTVVTERGEMKLRCKACSKVVEVRDWFRHRCMDLTYGATPQRLCGDCSAPLSDQHQWCPICSAVVGEGSETR